MKPKTIALAFLLVVTLVQGLPRTHRFKPVVNLNPEKVTTTQKPIEVRKSTLFPKNTKKYVVTDKPLPRMTAPSSYKYLLAKRPLMLKFEPSSSLLRNGHAVPHQSLMKKVNFVVSTPSPYEKNSKKSYWENRRPIHIRNNKTTEDNVVNNTMPQKPNENKDKITAQPQLNNMTTTESSKAPKNETREIILLPINEQELKSNPNAIADEVSDIIAFVNKLHETKENISKIGSTTEQPIEKRTSLHPTLLPSTKATESSSVYPTHDHTTIKNQDIDRRPTPNEDVIQPITSSTTEKAVTTLSPVQKDTITKSYSLKRNNDEINETGPEMVFIPVNISDLKSYPDLIAEEVKNVVKDISKHASQVTESTTVITTVASVSSSTTTSTVSPTPVTMGLAEPEIIILRKGERFPSSNSSSEDRQRPDDDVNNVIYLLSKNNLNEPSSTLTTKQSSYPTFDAMDVQKNNSFITKDQTTTPLTPIQKETITESYSLKGNKDESSAPEIVFIPVDLSDLKSHPDLIAEEVKNTVNEIKKHTSSVESSTSTTVSIMSTSTNPSITTTSTETTTAATNTTPILMGSEKPEIKINAKGEHSPSSNNNSKYSQNPDDDVENVIYHTPNNVLNNSNDDVPTETSTNIAISSTNNASSEILFIPVNLEELKSHPNLIANEVKNIIDNINRHTPKMDITTTTTTITNKAATVLTTSTPATTSTTTTTTTPKVDKHITSNSSHDLIFLPVNLADLKSHPNAIEDEIKDVVNLINNNPNNKKKSETTVTPSPKLKEVVSNTTPREYKIITSTSEPLSKEMSNPEAIVPVGSSEKQTSPEIIFIPVNLKDFESHPNDINGEIQDIVSNMNKPKSSDETNLTDKSLTTMNKDNTTESTKSLLPMQQDDKPIKNGSKNIMATENSLPTRDMVTERISTEPDFQLSTVSLNDLTTDNSRSKENITAEKSPEVVFIPVNLNDLESNPAIADEVRDIVDFMNKLHPHDNEVTASPDLKNTPQESELPKSEKMTDTTSAMPTTKILSTTSTTEDSVRKYSQNLETDVTTESLVRSTSEVSLTVKEDQKTTESSQREIVFIPIKLEELQSNPDLVADEVKDIVNYMSEKDKTNNNTTEQYTTEKEISSIKTTSEIHADTTTLKTSTITETTENIVTPKYIFIEPIEVTALKDEDENDIYVGNILRRPKVTDKQNDSEINKSANKSGKSNSISDDISDVIYVIKKN